MTEPAKDAPARRRRRPLWMPIAAALITFIGVFGVYMRQQAETRPNDAPESPSGLFIESQAAGTSLTAVGRIRGGPTDCTAWLLDPGTSSEQTPTPSPAPDAAAYAVTAGRCVGITDSRTVIVDRQLTGMTVEFNAFAPLTSAVAANVVPAPVTSVVWASMRGTDLALLQLANTYGELAGRGVRPIRPMSLPPEGEEILVAGVPTAGIPDEQKYLRGSRCNIGNHVDVLEYVWIWEEMASTDCEGIRAGSAGSVAFNVAGDALGMVTTTSIGANSAEACYLEAPCEVKGAGSAGLEGNRTYVLSVSELAECFQDGVFGLGGKCRLEAPDGVVPAGAEARAGTPGSRIDVQLIGTVAEGMQVATLQGPVGQVSCAADSSEWSRAVPAEQWSLSLRLPDGEGWLLACVGSPEHPTQIVVQSDGTPPDPGRIRLNETSVEGGISVEPVFDPPNLSAFRWVSGPRGAMDCAVAEGYTEYKRVPATIQADDLPATVCIIGVDDAGNASEPAAIEVD